MSDDDSLAEEEEFLHGLAAARVQGVHQEKGPNVGAPVEPPAPQQKKPSSHQPTLGLFFGNAVTKKYSTVRLPESEEEHQPVDEPEAGGSDDVDCDGLPEEEDPVQS